MQFTLFALKNLVRRLGRSTLTVAGLGVAVGAVVALVGVSHGFENSTMAIFRGHGIDLIVTRGGGADPQQSSLPQSLAAEVRKVAGVRDVSPVLMDSVSFPEKNLHTVGVQGLDPNAGLMLRGQEVLSGEHLAPGDGRVVVLGQILARNLDKKVGDVVELVPGESFTIKGIVKGHSVFEAGALTMPVDQLQALMNREGEVTWLNVALERADDKAEVQRVTAEIESLKQRLDLKSAISALPSRDYVESNSRLQAAAAMAWMTSAIAIVIGGIGMLNTMIMSVFERTQEIGVLRAIGWQKARVVRMILLEAILLSLTGALLGIVGGILLTRLLARVPAVNGIIEGQIDLSVVAQGVVIALIVGILGALYPAWRGARLLPTEALRHE